MSERSHIILARLELLQLQVQANLRASVIEAWRIVVMGVLVGAVNGYLGLDSIARWDAGGPDYQLFMGCLNLVSMVMVCVVPVRIVSGWVIGRWLLRAIRLDIQEMRRWL